MAGHQPTPGWPWSRWRTCPSRTPGSQPACGAPASTRWSPRTVFIPDYRVMSFTKAFEGSYPREDKDEALYRSAFMLYATAILAGPQLGLARAAFDLVLAKPARRGIAYTVYQRQTDSPGFRLAMAEAALRIVGAYLHALRVIREIDASAAHGPYPDYLARAHARAGISHAVKEAREAIRILVSAHGASSFAETNDLQRIWRDAEVASRHAIVSPETNADLFGSALVGLPPVQRHRPRLRLRVTRAMGGQAEDA